MESKGAIIIASLEGQVTVTNNETQAQLPASQVKAGGLLFDGHTIKTGPSSKIILLLSNGTVSTIKSDSALNIKKFTQEKFDPGKKKLSDMKGEPSSSQTVMDLELGDMVFDVKKLDKRSSFNIESPVGTAGIRGTSGQMGIMANNGATNLNINMFKGSVATQLRGSDIATMVRQGQSFSAGISASGIILPPTLGKVPPSLLASIEADLEASEGATGVSSVNDSSVPTSEGSEDVEDEAPSEEELQEQDADQAAAAKGVDDNGSEEAVALDKAGLIDLNDPEKLEKVDTYVKVSRKGADKLEEKAVARRLGRRAEGDKTESQFIGDLVGNFDDVVEVTEQAAEIGVESPEMFDSLLENSQNSGAVKEVVAVAAEIGVKDKANMESMFTNVDQADDLKEVMDVAKKTLGSDDGTGGKKLDSGSASILSSTLKNADKADSMKEVMETSADLGLQDAASLTAVFSNADKADDLKAVMDVAKSTLGAVDGSGKKKLDAGSASILASTLKNADKADSMKEVMETSADLGLQDASSLTAVFSNADKADDLKAVMDVAKSTLGADDGSGNKKLDAGSASILASTLKNADKADSMKEVMETSADLGLQDASSLTAVFSNADKADDLKAVMDVAKSTLGADDGSGKKKLDAGSASILASTLKNADKADSMKEVMETSADLGLQDAESLTNVFKNADKATDLKNVMDVAKKSLGTDDGSGNFKLDASSASILASTLQNADQADKLSEVMETSADLGLQDSASLTNVFKNADKATDLVAVMDVAKKSLGTDDGSGNFKLDASSASILASTLQNADKASAMKDVMETSAELGLQDATSLTNVFKNADKAADLVAVMDVAKKSLGTDDGSGNFKLDASSASILASTFQNADQASAMKDVMETSAELGLQDSASLTNVFKNADKAADLVAVMDVAKKSLGTDDGSGNFKLDASSASILASTLQNADKADSMKEVMEASADLGLQDATSLTAVFSNADKADDLMAVMDSAKKSLGTDDGSGTFKLDSSSASSLASVLQNADKASDFRKVTDQLGSIGLEGGNADVFSNIEDVAAVFVEVGDSASGSIDSDFAKNILGNAKEAGEVRKAIKMVQDNGGASNSADLLTLAKKDVSELKAINKVAEEFGGSGDALKAFVNDGLDQALQLEKAFEDGDIDATTISASVGTGGKFTDVVGNSVLEKLRSDYANNADILEVINLNTDKAQDINFARSFVQPGSPQESALFANLENIAPIMSLSNRFETEPANLEIVYNNLDVAASLDKLVSEFSIYPKQLNIIMQNADMAPAILDYETNFGLTPAMLNSSESLKSTLSNEGLAKLLNLYPDFADVIRLNADKAGEISGLLSLAGNKYANEILSNLDQFDTIEVLVFRSKQDAKKLESLFSNLIDLSRIKEISDSLVKENIPGGQDALFTNLSTFSRDPGYYLLALEHPRFMVRLHEMTGDLSRVSSTLAYELVVLNLTRDELLKVLSDLIEGPLSTGPVDAPPSDTTLSQEFAAVTILESHSFNGEIPIGMVLSESQVRASNLFQETLDVYYAIGLLDNDQNTDSTSSTSGTSTGLIGGVSLTFNPGKYDLSSLGYGSYLVASSDSITLSGALTFTSSTNVEELLFISAGGISVAEGTSIDFSGDSLGLGSFDSVKIVNVDLHAEDEIGVRSLDSIVINNSDFATRGTGADMIHLIAASELAIDNLRFSEQIRQITMEAMTINLSNLNFPAGSTVKLNSAYGGVDGVYPNFGSSAVGRVNFIQNVKYNSHLLNNKSAFDTYGSSITIGVSSN